MPRWGIHLAIGNKILEHKPNLDKNAFYLEIYYQIYKMGI